MFPRSLYTLVMYLLTPVILMRLARRGLHYRSYLGRWRERFGFFPRRVSGKASGSTRYPSARPTPRSP
ncbi:hypothetical protein [Tahibacter amnicola]|uniref:hypothetical protein n=1 Tax=Tahibacter amnicola TaxID=2976241 RepID=UPI0031BA9397